MLDSDPAPVPCSRVSEGTIRGWVGWVISGTDMMAEAGGIPTGLPLPVELDGVVATLSAPPGPWVLGVATVGDTGPGNGARSTILCSATSISCCCCNIAANCWLMACWTPCAADFATEFTRSTKVWIVVGLTPAVLTVTLDRCAAPHHSFLQPYCALQTS